ncbi:hypothetical protein GCM10009611_21780 [Arthrobacter roseus]
MDDVGGVLQILEDSTGECGFSDTRGASQKDPVTIGGFQTITHLSYQVVSASQRPHAKHHYPPQ